MSEEIKEAEKSSYRSIFKATSLFGGVQVYQILINVIKSKFIAILVGPTGVGIQGLYTSATQLIQNICSMGLSQSAVRDVSEASASGNQARVSLTVTVLRKLVWFTGLLGTIAVAVLSPLLSKSSFGNYDYTVPFIFLSVTLLLDQLSAGQKVVLQGMRKLKYLAKSSALGSTIGLFVSIPLYYLLGLKGIIPTLILHSVTSLCLTWYFSRKIKVEKVKVSTKQTMAEGKNMLQMGIAMSITTVLSMACAFVLRAFIRANGGVDAVGVFTAGYTIMMTYTGLVFTAMSTDYYPRLSSIQHDNSKCKEVINQQGEVGVLILSPLLQVCIVFVPIIVSLLYSNSFLEANTYIVLVAGGMLFKMASWAISFVFVAKGESKLFMINEVTSSAYILAFNLFGYKWMGLNGLGLSFMLSYIVYFLQVFFIAKTRYSFSYSRSFGHVFFLHNVLLFLCLGSSFLLSGVPRYIAGGISLLTTVMLSFKGLDERMGIVIMIKQKLNKQ